MHCLPLLPRLFAACLFAVGVRGQTAECLDNGRVRAEFDGRGLTALADRGTELRLELADAGFTVALGELVLEAEFLPPPTVEHTATSRTYRFHHGDVTVAVVYELQPDWGFVTKQLQLERRGEREFTVQRLDVARGRLGRAPQSTLGIRSGQLLRHPDLGRGASLFVLLQNPSGQWRLGDGRYALGYAVDQASLQRRTSSDRVCFGLVPWSGRRLPQHPAPEWKWMPDGTADAGPLLDTAEADALVDCARAFLQFRPRSTTRVHIGWCENDYQIDIGTAAGQAEYRRILDQAAAVGCTHVLFTPAHEALAKVADNRDAWSWENILWLGLGQKIRKDEWLPGRDPLPAAVQDLLDHARSRGLRPLAYVYPTLPFLQQKEWTAWIRGEPGGYLGADTGRRSFQDWLTAKLVGFADATGTAGYSFDHWWIAYDDASSRYAQWDGCRRVLAELRARLPDAVIDGRQQVHHFGVWTWLAGNYPHPLASDEQPESFPSFPDLHWDRASADRQRRTAYAYRHQEFVPVEIMPGYLSHQTGRLEANGNCPRTRFRPRDFDLLGFRYSVLSAIATAPCQLVVNYLPARDEGEFRAFGPEHRQWLRSWFDWTDANLDLLRRTRPVLGPVQLGRVDGTAACRDDHGFMFLFDPNYRPQSCSLALDAGLGLTKGERYVLRQLHPEAGRGRLLAPPTGTTFAAGAAVTLPLPGAEALVLQIEPAAATVTAPRLCGAPGTADLDGTTLRLRDVTGEPGTEVRLQVTLPADAAVTDCTVNGTAVAFDRQGQELTATVQFAGAPFARCQQLGVHDPQNRGGQFRATATIPARVLAQLRARQQAWPVDYDQDDLRCGYLAPHRLLLYLQIAEPDDATMHPVLRVDDRPVPLQPAYSSIVRSNPKHTFVGWFADLSALAPDVEHRFEVDLPTLAPGRFQGLFWDTVTTESTAQLAPR